MKAKITGIPAAFIVVLFLAVQTPVTVCAQQSEALDAAAWQEVVDKAVTYLRDQGQADDGSFSAYAGPGVTALVATGLMNTQIPSSDPMVTRALEYVTSFVKADGGIYAPDSLYANYETSLAILCLSAANADGTYDKLISDADAFIKRNQWGSEVNPVDPSDNRYGGSGYGKYGRPDLSNTTFTIDALLAAGNDENSEAIQRALIFVSRSQNFPSEHNQTGLAEKNPDGGFYYSPAGEGESKADKIDGGGLRSYASMTYAGLKSMLYAGVDRNDPRVQAAVEWIHRNYDLKTNPGMGAQGLYYYYHVFAKALGKMGENKFVDREGIEHDWRAELLMELKSRQNEAGFWTNVEHDRWLENDPNLVTGYVLMTLAWCKPAK